MEAPLKQRLIGATVLAAIALIFVPMLLQSPDVKDSDSADVPLQIPVEADSEGIKTIEIPLDGSMPIAADVLPSPANVAKPEDTAVTSTLENPEIPVIVPSNKLPETTAVAAGQFAVVISANNDAEAKAIVAALQAQKLLAKIQSNGKLFRVRIGPFASRELAELARLRSTAAVTGGSVVAMDAVVSTLPATTESAKPSVTIPAPATAVTTVKPQAAIPPTKTALSAQPVKKLDVTVAKGFAVQIGAPANEQAAILLRDRARAAGFSSFIQPVDTETGRRYRVRVGPEHSRDDALKMLADVKQKLGIAGIVVPHP